jgi:hypothetical protein
VAKAEYGEPDLEDPRKWFFDKFQEEPRYDQLLARLAKSLLKNKRLLT